MFEVTKRRKDFLGFRFTKLVFWGQSDSAKFLLKGEGFLKSKAHSTVSQFNQWKAKRVDTCCMYLF